MYKSSCAVELSNLVTCNKYCVSNGTYLGLPLVDNRITMQWEQSPSSTRDSDSSSKTATTKSTLVKSTLGR